MLRTVSITLIASFLCSIAFAGSPPPDVGCCTAQLASDRCYEDATGCHRKTWRNPQPFLICYRTKEFCDKLAKYGTYDCEAAGPGVGCTQDPLLKQEWKDGGVCVPSMWGKHGGESCQ